MRVRLEKKMNFLIIWKLTKLIYYYLVSWKLILAANNISMRNQLGSLILNKIFLGILNLYIWINNQ